MAESRVSTHPSSSTIDGYGTPEDVQKLLKIGSKLFWLLVDQNAFPVVRLTSSTGRGSSRKVFVKLTDVSAYLDRLHASATATG